MSVFDSEKALREWRSGWYEMTFDKEVGFNAGYQAAVEDYLKFMTGQKES